MTKYIIKRFVWLILTLTGSMLILFSLLYFVPGDPASILLGQKATPEIREALIHRLGLDQPMPIRFAKYVWNILQGNWGKSIWTGESVLPAILRVLPYTFILAVAGMGISIIIGCGLGILAVFYKNSIYDHITSLFSLIAASTVDYVAAVLLLLFFSVSLRWFPSLGMGTKGNILDQFFHLILPAFALAISWSGYIARLTRASLLETLDSDYIKTTRLFGIPKVRIIYKYAFKNAIKPIIAIIGMGFGRLLGGALFIEIVFTRIGLGRYTIEAIRNRDFPAVQGGVLMSVLLFAIAIICLLYTSPSPRDLSTSRMPSSA